MNNRVQGTDQRKDVYLLMGILLAGLLVVPFAQFGQAQEAEGLIRIHASEEFAALMKESPETARKRFEEGIFITYKGERPIRIRLYSAVIVEGEIQRQHLSDTAVTIEPGASKPLAAPDDKPDWFPGSKWIPGPRWLPGSGWVPNPEIVPEGLRFSKETFGKDGLEFVQPEGLRTALLLASKRTDKASPLLYLAAVPGKELDGIGDLPIGSLPLVIGGPEFRFPGSKWVPGNEWVMG